MRSWNGPAVARFELEAIAPYRSSILIAPSMSRSRVVDVPPYVVHDGAEELPPIPERSHATAQVTLAARARKAKSALIHFTTARNDAPALPICARTVDA